MYAPRNRDTPATVARVNERFTRVWDLDCVQSLLISLPRKIEPEFGLRRYQVGEFWIDSSEHDDRDLIAAIRLLELSRIRLAPSIHSGISETSATFSGFSRSGYRVANWSVRGFVFASIAIRYESGESTKVLARVTRSLGIALVREVEDQIRRAR